MFLKRNLFWLMILCYALPSISAAQITIVELPAISLNPVGSGARAAGKSYAFIAVADDATAASHNPGGLAQLEKPEISIVGSYFLRSGHPDDDSPPGYPDDDSPDDEQIVDNAEFDFLSIVFPFQLLGRNVVVSLQAHRLFQQESTLDYTLDYSRMTTLESTTQLKFRRHGSLYSISPAVAARITSNFMIGVAFNIWPDIFDNGWKTETTLLENGEPQQDSKSDFSFEGFNITAGFLWKIDSIFTLGGVFRSPFDASITHTNKKSGILEESLTETLKMKMPLSYGLGISARMSDNLTISMDVSWVQWSDFHLETPDASFVLPAGKSNLLVLPDFRNVSRGDTTSIRLGVEYLGFSLNAALIPLRAGFFYEPEPDFEGTTDFFGFSFGTGIAVKGILLDIAYTFRTGKRTELIVQNESESIRTKQNVNVYENNILMSIIVYF